MLCYPGILCSLVRAGANPNYITKQGAVLQRVAAEGISSAVEVLVKYGKADVDFAKPGYSTPLQTACEKRHPHVVKALIAYGAQPIDEAKPYM